MKKIYILTTVLCSISLMIYGQGETDALRFSQLDMRGTARYMSMAGAFGALGGDITTLSQNPAGIGVYRSSEIVTTFGFDNFSNNVSATGGKVNSSDFRFAFNNIGAIGTINTGNNSGLVNFNFGFAYNRLKTFNRNYRAKFDNLQTSLTNYIANRTGGIPEQDLILKDNYDPYNSVSWLPVLAYESSLISPLPVGEDGNQQYFGLFNGPNTIGYYPEDPDSKGYADLYVREKGRIDEYSLNLGGNISNKVYFGLGVGIVDIDYTQKTEYIENITNPRYPDKRMAQESGNINLSNYLQTRGTGFNFKLGLIARLTDFWRLGFAFHTPTVYTMRDEYWASVNNSAILEQSNPGEADSPFIPIYRTTPDDHVYYTDYKYNSPWRIMASTAFIIGKKGIVSFDYEYTGYNKMKMSDEDGVALYGDYGYTVNDLIREDFKAGHTFKIGGEYRLTPQLSLRAGYANQLSPVKATILDMNTEVITAGTQPMYNLNRSTQYFTAGAGYRFGQVYIDLAYINKLNKEDVFPYSPTFIGDKADLPSVAKLTGHTNSLMLTLGYKF